MKPNDLKNLRTAMGLRQSGLAKALGLTPQFIGMMERGEKAIEARTALSVMYLVDHPEARPEIEDADLVSFSLAELVKTYDPQRGLRDGRTWGRWRFNADSLTLDLDSEEVVIDRDDEGNDVMGRRERYYVMLCDLTNKEMVLEWIGQIAGKAWGPVTLGHFVDAIDEIFDIQGTFVHGKGFASGDAVAAFIRGSLRAAERVTTA